MKGQWKQNRIVKMCEGERLKPEREKGKNHGYI